MKLNKYFFLCLVAIMPSTVSAEPNSSDYSYTQTENEFKPYVSLMGGYARNKWLDSKKGINATVAIGATYNSFNHEIAISNYDSGRKEKLEHVTTRTTLFSAMINSYYNFNTNTFLTPYMGVGIGLSSIEIEKKGTYMKDGNVTPINNYRKSSGVCSLTLGTTFNVSENFNFLVHFKSMQTLKKINYGHYANRSERVKNNSLNIGFRYYFPL